MTRRARLLGTALAALLALPASPAVPLAPAAAPASASAVPAQHQPAASPRTVTLGGVPVRLRHGTRQVVTVNHRDGWHARVRFWGRHHGAWHEVLTARDGRTGYGGLVRPRQREQGTGTTPLGTHRLLFAFGMHDRRRGWDRSYRRAGPGDYWVLDNRSDHYNRWRNRHRGGFRWWLSSGENASERLRDYRSQYEFAVATGFNRRQVRHRGGAIFLHVNGDGATAGCVSAPRGFMKRVVGRLDPDRHPVIAVGR